MLNVIMPSVTSNCYVESHYVEYLVVLKVVRVTKMVFFSNTIRIGSMNTIVISQYDVL